MSFCKYSHIFSPFFIELQLSSQKYNGTVFHLSTLLIYLFFFRYTYTYIFTRLILYRVTYFAVDIPSIWVISRKHLFQFGFFFTTSISSSWRETRKSEMRLRFVTQRKFSQAQSSRKKLESEKLDRLNGT
ncbi:hypothetical protein CLIB1423_05S01354 [[Candida] railenensis]|uniref:Uncharacterized protein n=1 Tax=[Candida] railenensis TaxID=45579 RepID=A0A9P0VXH5_9ASCO|nr:hypothetical protein CLIB1423_05S01354 [[Candida] railenensis]